MENNDNQNLAGSLCQAGCGFFGNAQFDGMCSKCYKDSVKRKNAAPIDSSTSICNSSGAPTAIATTLPDTTPSVETAQPTINVVMSPGGAMALDKPTNLSSSANATSGGAACSTDCVPTTSASPGAIGEECDSGTESPSKSKRNRCFMCKKKVGLTGFECRCGGVFCSVHRYSDKHSCGFDYKKHGSDHIRKNNPLVVGSKVQKL